MWKKWENKSEIENNFKTSILTRPVEEVKIKICFGWYQFPIIFLFDFSYSNHNAPR